MTDDMITLDEAAALAHVSVRTLGRWRAAGQLVTEERRSDSGQRALVVSRAAVEALTIPMLHPLGDQPDDETEEG